MAIKKDFFRFIEIHFNDKINTTIYETKLVHKFLLKYFFSKYVFFNKLIYSLLDRQILGTGNRFNILRKKRKQIGIFFPFHYYHYLSNFE